MSARVRLPREEDFGSRLRSPAVAARVGLWLGIAFGVCFLTGLVIAALLVRRPRHLEAGGGGPGGARARR